MRENPHLLVYSLNGIYDLATPFFGTEYDLGHMQLDPALRGNVRFAYYPSGHMVYLNPDALRSMKADLATLLRRGGAGALKPRLPPPAALQAGLATAHPYGPIHGRGRSRSRLAFAPAAFAAGKVALVSATRRVTEGASQRRRCA